MMETAKHHYAKQAIDDSIDLEAVRIYFGSPEFRDKVSEPDFEKRCSALFAAFDEGKPMTLADAAKFVGLPWDAFGVLIATFAPVYLRELSRRIMQ